jgi:hypothetical protein
MVLFCGAPSLTRGRVCLVYGAGPRQHSSSPFPWDSWLYFTVSDLRLPFRRLLQLAGSRWRYLTLPPHGFNTVICQSPSQSYIATDGRSISKSWCRAPPGAHDQIFIIIWQLRSYFYGAPSLTRGQVCLMYMLLVLACAVFLGSESLGSREPYFTVSVLRLPFSSPPTSHRVTVEVFNPASTRVDTVIWHSYSAFIV